MGDAEHPQLPPTSEVGVPGLAAVAAALAAYALSVWAPSAVRFVAVVLAAAAAFGGVRVALAR